jgi:acyl-[acyl-carrier-protein]-phospholipid O-acyltransferase / long-chain-fatty-acid--[acyl-carrier-protein] ligase
MIREKRFYGVSLSYSLGVFNDNAFKTAVIFSVVDMLVMQKFGTVSGAESELFGLGLNSEVSFYFSLPFVLFATLAGWASDRFSRSSILKVTKFTEIGVMLLGAWTIYMFQQQPDKIATWHSLLLATVFLMSFQSTFFSPARNGIIPQLFTEKESSEANGLIEMMQFMAIIFGTAVSSFALKNPWLLLIFPSVALIGALVSLKIPKTPAQDKSLKFNFNVIGDLYGSLKSVSKNKSLLFSILGESYFYGIGVVLITCVLNMAKFSLGIEDAEAIKLQGSLLLVVLSVGMGLGCFLAGKLSRGIIELGLVPIGISGLMLFMYDLSNAETVMRAGIDLGLMGIFGGFFILPLKVYVQQRSDEKQRGRILAFDNFISFVFMLGASYLVFAGSDQGWFQDTRTVLKVCVAVTGVVGLFAFYRLPNFFVRFVIVCVTRTCYKMKVEGAENIPETGPVLLLPNHVTWLDGFMITAATSRQVRFLISDLYYNIPIFKPFFKWANFIPVPEAKGKKALLACIKAARESLENGDVLCVFPEGQLTRSGVMSEFKSGFTKMLPERKDVAIIPLYVGLSWGSVFSFKHGETVRPRIPKKFPYPLNIKIGEALPYDVTAQEARYQVREMEMKVESETFNEERPLHADFLRHARLAPFGKIIQDSDGKPVKNITVLMKSLAIRNWLKKTEEEGEDYIGILLPTCVAGTVSALAVMYADKIPVFLNFTASKDSLEHAAKKCNMKRILTSKRFMHKIKVTLPEGVEIVYLEEVAKNMPADCKSKAMRSLMVPSFILEKQLFPKSCRDIHSVATVLFSSGSTGTPKGVVLTHLNFTSNLSGLMRVFNVDKSDSLLGSMPLFHCFGFLSSFWLPLSYHNKIVYHPNPLEANKVGELICEHKLAILFGTPTFLNNYARRCKPEQLKSLKVVLSGAEKLRQSVAEAFFETAGVYPIEAYGATELSPGVSVNIPMNVWELGKKQGKKGSVGHPLPGVLVKVVNSESHELLKYGEEGLLMVKGPGVMQGYLDEPEKTAEVLKDGWYSTGDLGKIDSDGYITLTGRMSRFSKVAGEMVPHGGVEEALQEALGTEEMKFVVVGKPDKSKGEKLVVLHLDLGKEIKEIITALKEREIPNLWIPKMNDFHLIEEIPLLGTGKLNLKAINDIEV